MSLSASALAEQPLSSAPPDAVKTKTPPKRQTVAVASTTLIPEPR